VCKRTFGNVKSGERSSRSVPHQTQQELRSPCANPTTIAVGFESAFVSVSGAQVQPPNPPLFFNTTRNNFAEVGHRYAYVDYTNGGFLYQVNAFDLFSGIGMTF